MIDFFKGLYRKLRTAVLGNPYQREYSELINIFRTTTPIGKEEINRIYEILQHLVPDRSALDSRFALIRAAMRSRAGAVGDIRARYRTFIADEYTRLQRPRVNRNRDVSYCVNGAVVYGDVGSDDEPVYFNRDNIAALNSLPLRAKRCDLGCVVSDCQACIEARLRREIAATMQAEQERARSEQVKRRHVAADRGVVNDLNVRLGCPLVIARSLADEAFDIEELESAEREEFLRWRANNQRLSEQMNRGFLIESEKTGADSDIRSLNDQMANNIFSSKLLNNPFAGNNEQVDEISSPEDTNGDVFCIEAENAPTGPSAVPQPALQNPFSGGSKAGLSPKAKASNLAGETPPGGAENPFMKAFDGENAIKGGSVDQTNNGDKIGENEVNIVGDKIRDDADIDKIVNNKVNGGTKDGPFAGRREASVKDSNLLPKNPTFSFEDPFKNTGLPEDSSNIKGPQNKPFVPQRLPANLFGNANPLSGDSISRAPASPFAGLSGSSRTVPSPFSTGRDLGLMGSGRTLTNPFNSPAPDGAIGMPNAFATKGAASPFAAKGPDNPFAAKGADNLFAAKGADNPFAAKGTEPFNPFAAKGTEPTDSSTYKGTELPNLSTYKGAEPPNLPTYKGTEPSNPFGNQVLGASHPNPFDPGVQINNPFNRNTQPISPFNPGGAAAPLNANPPGQAFGTEQFNPFLNSNFSQTNIFQNRQPGNDNETDVFANNDESEVKSRRAKRKR